MPLLQFAPFASLVEPAFWHALTQRKIDVLRLSDAPLPVAAAYTPGRTIRDRETGADVGLGCHLGVGGEAFDGVDAQCVMAAFEYVGAGAEERQDSAGRGARDGRVPELQHDRGLQGRGQERAAERGGRSGRQSLSLPRTQL
jgi:hypothetical protein